MKIGIITFWQSNDNYGQLLQCWALQHYLRSKGHDAYLIRYDFAGRNNSKPLWKKILKALTIYPLIKHFVHRKTECAKNKLIVELNAKNKQRHFDDFRRDMLQMTDEIYHSLKELQSSPPTADIYITGSDQVWSQLLNNKENEVFFLNFGGKTVKRIAYAASFGLKVYPPKLNRFLINNLKRFDSISVREYDGVSICKNVGVLATKVLDPTLLLNRKEYLNMVAKPRYKNYIYIYSLNVSAPEELCFSQIKVFAQSKNASIIVTPASGYVLGKEIYKDVTYDYPTVQNWLSNICYARLVVTTSFHGIVFCIILHTPFIYIPLTGSLSKMNNRVTDLLKSIGLNDRIIENKEDIEKKTDVPIIWDECENILSVSLKESEHFLNDSINKYIDKT